MKSLKIKINQILTAVLLFLLYNNVFSQYQIRSYDLFCNIPGDDHGTSIINRIDNGYAIAGYSYASACGVGSPQDWMFLKLKADGLIDTVRLIGFEGDDRAYSIIQSAVDTGYVMAGSMVNGNYIKATLVKLNKSAGLEYSKRVSSSYNSQYNQVVKNYADRWTFAGYSQHYIAENKIPYKILVTNYSSAGVRQWGYKYITLNSSGSSNVFNDAANSVCFQNTDSTYCVAAKTSYYSANNSNYDIMVMKISPTGTVRWNRIYRFDLNPAPNYYTSAEPRKIIALPDGGFVIVGSTNVNVETERDIIVMRISSTGAIVWSRIYGNAGYVEKGESVVLDGDLIITGARKKVSLSYDVIVMKIPLAGGAPVWVRRWDPNNSHDYGFDIVKSNIGAPNGYAITGESIRGGLSDPFLMRVNSSGRVEGQTCMETITLSNSVKTQKVDSVTISRSSVSDVSWTPGIVTPPSNVNDICLTADNPIGENTNTQPGKFSLEQNYPNPFNPMTKIAYQLPTAGFVSIIVFDILGKEVATLVSNMQNSGLYEVTFNANKLSSGIYLYKLSITDPSNSSYELFAETKKMLLVK